MLRGSVLYRGHHLRAQTASILGCWSCREEFSIYSCVAFWGRLPLSLLQGWVGMLLLCQAFALLRTLLQDLSGTQDIGRMRPKKS